MFHQLGREQIDRIVDIQLERVQKLLAERRISIEVTDAAKDLLAEKGYDPHYGARPLKRVIQRLLQDPLAMKILEGEFPEGSKVRRGRAREWARRSSSGAPRVEGVRCRALRRAIVIAGIWLVALAGGLALAPRLASVAVTDPLDFFPRDSRTRRADAALTEWFPAARAPSQIVIVIEGESPGGTDAIFPGARDRIRALAGRLRAELPSDALTAVLSPADDPVLAERLVAADRRAALVVLRLSLGFASERASAVVAQAEQITGAEIAPGSGLRASFSGEATLGRDYLAAIEEGGRRSGLATLALVAVTLLVVYRSPVAALVSLATLGAALGVTLGAVTLAAQLGLPVAYQARGFLVALLFGIGTDYCLLLFARVREAAAARRRRSRSARRGASRRP